VTPSGSAWSTPDCSKLLLSRREAAAVRHEPQSFQRHVQPSIRCAYSGRLRLYRPLELARWIEREVERSEGMRAMADEPRRR